MIIIICFAIFGLVLANEGLTAVHYSLVNPGIDNNITACKLELITNEV